MNAYSKIEKQIHITYILKQLRVLRQMTQPGVQTKGKRWREMFRDLSMRELDESDSASDSDSQSDSQSDSEGDESKKH